MSGIRRALAASSVTLIALIGCLVPLIASQLDVPQFEEGTTEYFLFSSFGDRMVVTWPSSFRLLDTWQYVLGRGIGGIGVAQSYFELPRYSPADNFFVYCYVTAGLLGALFYLTFGFLAWKLQLSRTSERLCYCIILFVFVYGITVNVVESAVALMALGAATGHLAQRQTQAYRARHDEYETYPDAAYPD